MFSRRRSDSTSSTDESQIRKFPFRRLELTVTRFIKVLQIDIERLSQHKYNIEKYTRYCDLKLLNREHINASRTVQQLKTNLVELDRTRLQVDDADLKEYDRKTTRIRNDAAKILEEFIEMCAIERKHLNLDRTCSSSTQSLSSTSPPHDFEELPGPNEVLSLQRSELLEADLEAMQEAEESWNKLQNDINDLNELMRDLARCVHEQQEHIDSIEDHIDHSLTDVEEGTSQLAQASKYKAALYPLTGALIGCAVGGPVGFVAGMKLGLAASLGGGLIGATGGRLIKKFSNQETDGEMIELREKLSSSSCPADLDKVQ